MTRHLVFPAAGLLAMLLMAFSVRAEQAKDFGDYTIHYSAFTTDILSPEVAKSYKISRSKNRIMLNISVLKKIMGTTGQPVKAKIEATATNLNSQLKQLEVRELNDHGAIYYIAEATVNHKETLKFNISALPEGVETPFVFSFQQQFFVD